MVAVAAPSAPTQRDRLVGTTLDGRFELVEFLAAGGMGRVYRAIQHPLGRVVAVKTLADHTEDGEEFRRRFFLEASLCARLSHPNTVRIFDFGVHDARVYYIAMELLKGSDLRQIVRGSGPLPQLRAIGIIKQVLAALSEAHESKLVHRDLKPSNVIVESNKISGDLVKIVDFGIARDTAMEARITQTGNTMGSPKYMSPEQIRDQDLDGRSDIYAAGCLLYYLLTGQPPFASHDAVQTVVKHLTEAPPTLAEGLRERTFSGSLQAVIDTALRKSPDDRFSDAQAMFEALSRIEEELGIRPGEHIVIESVLPTRLPSDYPSQFTEMQTAPMYTTILNESELEEVDVIQQSLPPPAGGTSEVQAEAEAKALIEPAEESSCTPLESAEIGRMMAMQLDDHVAYIDLNCPFCFALHERLTRWSLTEKIECRMVEHSSHVMEGPFELEDEQLLAKEVYEVHHRAPDVQLCLPPRRCCSRMANRLIVQAGRQSPEQGHSVRLELYRMLWQQGMDIGDPEVLTALLRRLDLPVSMLDRCVDENDETRSWQTAWEQADFDCCIPVMTGAGPERVMVGLGTERSLLEFLTGERSRVIDSAVCHYQRKPVLLLSGSLAHLWSMLQDARASCELLTSPTARNALEQLGQPALPDLLVIEAEAHTYMEISQLAEAAMTRSVHWIVATRKPSAEDEIRVLSMGAGEYLPVTDNPTVARARLRRILGDRLRAHQGNTQDRVDELTRVASRQQLFEVMDAEWKRADRTRAPLSLVLVRVHEFEAYNKAHGYLTGDRTLTEIAQTLKASITRAGDLLARFSGDEFAVLLPSTASAEARQIAGQLQQTIAAMKIENRALHGGPILTVQTISSTTQPGTGNSVHDLYDQASRAWE